MKASPSYMKMKFSSFADLYDFQKKYKHPNGLEPLSYEVTYIYDKKALVERENGIGYIYENWPPKGYEDLKIGTYEGMDLVQKLKADPTQKPKEDPVQKLKADPTQKPKEDPVQELIAGLTQKPNEDPVQKLKADPFQKPKEDPVQKLKAEPGPLPVKEVVYFQNEYLYYESLLKFPKFVEYLEAKNLLIYLEDLERKMFSLSKGTEISRNEALNFLKSMRISKYYFEKQKLGPNGRKPKDLLITSLRELYFNQVLHKKMACYLGRNKETIYDILPEKDINNITYKGILLLLSVKFDFSTFCATFEEFFKKMIHFTFVLDTSERQWEATKIFWDEVCKESSGSLVVWNEGAKYDRREGRKDQQLLHLFGKPTAWKNLLESRPFRFLRGSPSVIFHNRFPKSRDLHPTITNVLQRLRFENKILEIIEEGSYKCYNFRANPTALSSIISKFISIVEELEEFEEDECFLESIFDRNQEKHDSNPIFKPNPILNPEPIISPPKNLNTALKFSQIFNIEALYNRLTKNEDYFTVFADPSKTKDYFTQLLKNPCDVNMHRVNNSNLLHCFLKNYHDFGGNFIVLGCISRANQPLKMLENMDAREQILTMENVSKYFGDLSEDFNNLEKYLNPDGATKFEFLAFLCIKETYEILDGSILPLCYFEI